MLIDNIISISKVEDICIVAVSAVKRIVALAANNYIIPVTAVNSFPVIGAGKEICTVCTAKGIYSVSSKSVWHNLEDFSSIFS